MMFAGAVASSSYNLDTQKVVTAFSTPPTQARAKIINALIVRLQLANVWSGFDNWWLLAAEDQQAARVNWKAPGVSFTLTAVNSPTFTTDRGYAGNGTTSYLSSGWIPSTHGVQYASGSSSVLCWVRTNTASTSTITGSTNDFIRNRISTSFIAGRQSGTTTTNSSTTHTAAGFAAITRPDASNINFWLNGAQLGTTVASADGVMSTTEIFICAGNNAGSPGSPTTKEISWVAWGRNFTSGEITSIYNAVNTYLTAVGAA